MLNIKQYFIFYLTIMIIGSAAIPAFAKSSSALVIDGNRAFQQGKFDEAIEAYEKATVDEPESPHIYFNKGTAQYMKGDYRKAVEFFEKAAFKSKDLTLEARSYYNMGNSSFRESERQRDSDLEKSVKELEKAIGFYQKALKLNPELKESVHNIEVARLTIKQILDEIKKQKEKEKEDQEKQQQLAEKLKELIKRQEKLGQETKVLGQEKKEKKKKEALKAITDISRDDLAEDQQGIRKETEQVAEQISSQQQAKPDPMAEKIEDHLRRSASEQSEAENELRKGDPEKAHPNQTEAVEELKKALEAMSQDQKDKSQQDQQDQQEQKKQEEQQQSSDQQDEEQKKDEESQGADQKDQDQKDQEQKDQEQKDQQQKQAMQIDEDAHDILDEERKNRDKRQLRAPGGYKPIDKDW